MQTHSIPRSRRSGKRKPASKCEDALRSHVRHCFRGWRVCFNHRPNWLAGLEVDVLIPELKLAFEMNGRQHYQFVPHFHGDEKGFAYQQERDRDKARLCAENGVTLVVLTDEQTTRKAFLIHLGIVGVKPCCKPLPPKPPAPPQRPREDWLPARTRKTESWEFSPIGVKAAPPLPPVPQPHQVGKKQKEVKFPDRKKHQGAQVSSRGTAGTLGALSRKQAQEDW